MVRSHAPAPTPVSPRSVRQVFHSRMNQGRDTGQLRTQERSPIPLLTWLMKINVSASRPSHSPRSQFRVAQSGDTRMFIVWRIVLSIVATVTFGLLTVSRRSRIVTVFAVVFLLAMVGLAVGVTIEEVREHRAEKAAGEDAVQPRSLTPSGLPTDTPAPWTPGTGSGSGEHPRGAAAPSPLPGAR